MPLSLLALAAGAFGIGTTEFIIMGLLTQVGADLGISIPTAGTLISRYAVGVVLGVPLLTIATRHWPRKQLLMALCSSSSPAMPPPRWRLATAG